MNDDEVAVDSDSRGGEGGYIHGDAHSETEEFAEQMGQYPTVEEGSDRGEGGSDYTHQKVRDGQVGDEEVGDGLHGFTSKHHVNYDGVPQQTQ